ncbi:MAG TPA: hypothetical protein H9896_05910 [Candidatus Pygmaiobacter gallistercoris]|nr:hypothetical protein [Candidatus Pygmaiobacter gallistercoris]
MTRKIDPAKGCFFVLVALCALFALVLGVLITSLWDQPFYQPAVIRVTGARAERTDEGCLVTLELENRSSTAASLTADDFYLYDAENGPLYELQQVSHRGNPFSSGWEVSLPAGRSGSIEILVTPPAGETLTVHWYEGDEGYQLTVPIA